MPQPNQNPPEKKREVPEPERLPDPKSPDPRDIERKPPGELEFPGQQPPEPDKKLAPNHPRGR